MESCLGCSGQQQPRLSRKLYPTLPPTLTVLTIQAAYIPRGLAAWMLRDAGEESPVRPSTRYFY